MNSRNNTPLLLLPDVLVCEIFKFLDACEFLNCKILCKKIKELKLQGNYRPFCIMPNHDTDKMLKYLSYLPLRYLNLSWCAKITDQGLMYLSTMPLQHLVLYQCTQITDHGLKYLSTLPLQHLGLSGCNLITDQGLLNISTMPLRYLDLLFCNLITDLGLVSINHTITTIIKQQPRYNYMGF
jgi:hypothetical protein